MCRPDPPSTSSSSLSSSSSSISRTNNKSRIITGPELKKHNTPYDSWCAVHNKVLNISDFAKRHPGGDLILLASGRDATVLFETYHPRGVPDALVDKLQVGVMKEGSFPASFYSWSSPFYSTLKSRVLARLDSLDLPRRGTTGIQVKAVFLLCSFWLCMYEMFVSDFAVACMWSVLMGLTASFIGTCIQHDGNHGAFSTKRVWNKAAGWTLDMIGASAFTWELQHMLGHHPYTNLLDGVEENKKENGRDCPLEEKDQESDPDVFSSFPLMRMHPLHSSSWYHRYQHLYAPLLFSLMTLSKVFSQDIAVIREMRLYHIDASCRYSSVWNRIRFWGMKLLSVLYMIALPCYFHGIRKGLILFTIGHLSCGEMLATMFIVNHVIEGVAFAQKQPPQTDANSERPTQHPPSLQVASGDQSFKMSSSSPVPANDWAAVQCQTSVNWSPGSWFWNHFSGGLSHQIEHHLFPSITHTNYVYIQDVVERTCKEFQVPYRSETNLGVAYWKMLRHLKALGSNDTVVADQKKMK